MGLALEIALVGMSSVFILLMLLILLITFVSKLTAYFTPEEKIAENNTLSDELLKQIISAAIKKHRINHPSE